MGDGGGGDSFPLENLRWIRVQRDVNFYLNSVLQYCTHTLRGWDGWEMGGGGDSSLPRKFMADTGAEKCELLLKYCLTILHSYFERLSGWEMGGGWLIPPKNVWWIQIFFNDNDKLVTNDKMMGLFGMMGWNIPLTIRADYLLKLICCEWLGDGLEMGGVIHLPLKIYSRYRCGEMWSFT